MPICDKNCTPNCLDSTMSYMKRQDILSDFFFAGIAFFCSCMLKCRNRTVSV